MANSWSWGVCRRITWVYGWRGRESDMGVRRSSGQHALETDLRGLAAIVLFDRDAHGAAPVPDVDADLKECVREAQLHLVAMANEPRCKICYPPS